MNQIDRNLAAALQRPSTPNIAVVQLHQRVDIHDMATVSDSQLFSFAESSCTPMTWIPETIAVQDLSKAFLRREISILDKAVQALSFRWFENAPADLEVPPVNVSWFLGVKATSNSAVHREALMQTYQLRDLTESPPDSWVHSVDIGLSHLSVYLSGLEMHEENATVNNLRVDLWTAMAAVYPGNNTAGRLIDALTGMSINLSNTGDTAQSNIISHEALRLLESTTEISGSKAIQALHIAQNLSTESKNITDPSMALNLAESSVRHVEAVLDLDHEATKILPTDSKMGEVGSVNTVANIVARDFPHDALFTYASMILRLSETQIRNNLFVESNRSAKYALVILHHLSTSHPLSSRILPLLSHVFELLSLAKLATLNTASENSSYSDERVKIVKQLAEIDPKRYVLSLMSALYSKRANLLAAGKESRAYQVHQQLIDVGSMVVDKHANMQIPSETEGDYYFTLAGYHFSWGRCQDAVYAVKNAMVQYSALETMIPGQSPVKYFRAALLLCKTHFFLKQYEACIAEGFKALQALEKTSTPGDRIPLDNEHMELLDQMMEALEATSHSKALAQARDINSRIKALFASAQSRGYQIILQKAQAPNRYAAILQKNDCLEEAARYLDETLKRWNDTYGENLKNTMLGFSQLQCLMALPSVFQEKCETSEALKYNQQAMDVAEELFGKGLIPASLEAIIHNNLASTRIDLLCDAGRYSEALELSEYTVAHAREHEAAGGCNPSALVQALCGRTLCQLYALQPLAAIVTASEGVALSRTALELGSTPKDSAPTLLTVLYVSLLNLSAGLGDAGDVDEALLRLAEAKETLVKEEVARGDVVGSDVHNYQVVATKRARLLIAKGEYSEAVGLLEEVIEEERESAKAQKSVIPSLINALQVAGIVYCTLGRHDDGMYSATEVMGLKQSLAPSSGLARLVEVRERSVTSRGLWRAVRGAKEKLKCHHQDSILFDRS